MPVLFKKKTYRSKKMLEFTRSMNCVACGTSPCDPHHLNSKGKNQGGMGIKVSDYRVVPLCRQHHTEYHQIGKDAFARRYNIDLREELINNLEAYIAEEEQDENR